MAPLLAVLLLAAVNPKPRVTVRLLTSRSPALPLGVWLAAGGVGGAVLSGLATALALREGRGRFRAGDDDRTQPRREPWSDATWPMGRAKPPSESEEARRPASEWPDGAGFPQAGPARAPGEPPPTVSVPFRVLRRSQQPAAAASTSPTHATASPSWGGSEPTVGAAAQGSDDWNSADDDDW